MDDVADVRERRQFILMQLRIQEFRDGRRSIGSTVADLESLFNALEQTPEEWKDRFIDQWGVLEIAYAVALDRRQELPTASDWDIAEALDTLDSLIGEWIPPRS